MLKWAAAPASSYQEGHLHYPSEDGSYALQGKILLLVVVAAFSLYLLVIVVFLPFLRRGGGSDKSDGEVGIC